MFYPNLTTKRNITHTKMLVALATHDFVWVKYMLKLYFESADFYWLFNCYQIKFTPTKSYFSLTRPTTSSEVKLKEY